MYLTEQIKKDKSGKSYGPYRIMRIYVSEGRRASLYLPRGVSFQEYMSTNPERCNEFLMYARKKDGKQKLPPEVGTVVYGRCFPSGLKELLETCGYNVVGSRQQRNRKTFFTIDSARVRFSLLDDESQKRIKSPETLLQMCIFANQKLKASNARRRSGTYDMFFAEALNTIQ